MPKTPPTDLSGIVLDVLARAPDWLRRDLASEQPGQRATAEETLAAMLTAALGKVASDQAD